MAEKKWLKWVVGISSVLAFTGYLYMTQKENLNPEVLGAMEPEKRGLTDLDAAADSYQVNSRLGHSKAEIFLFEAEKIEQILKWSAEQKSSREQLLEALNWEADPDAELTIPAQADRIEQKSTRSNLKTRRS